MVEADKGEESLSPLGRFDGLRIDRGRGEIALPRRYFPLVNLDQPLPTRLTTGEALHVAGTLEGISAPAHLLLLVGSDEETYWTFQFLVEEGRFERTIVLPRAAEDAFYLVLYLLPPDEDPVALDVYSHLDITGGAEPVEIPRLFFSGIELDQPQPVRWPVRRPVLLAGEVRPFVRSFWLVLEPLGSGGRRLIFPGVEEGRFRFSVLLRAHESGPVRLSVMLQLRDYTVWPAGEIVIEGVAAPLPDLEVGVLALSLLAGGQGRVPLFNRGTAAVELEAPEVEGPFEVEDHPSALAPGETGEIVLNYGGSGGDQGLLTLVSDDPLRPRVSIALSGLGAREAASDLVHLRADASGRIEAGVDLEERDLVLALYAAPVGRFDPSRAYDISLDGSTALARPAAARPDRRDSIDYRARQLERTLSLRMQQQGRPAARPAAVHYEVGDRRAFRFTAEGRVPSQSVQATVAAVNDLVVAWIQDDLREDDDNIDPGRMQAIIDQFAEDYPLVVETFGAPSDVDGDGRVAVLVTHLMQDVGAGGQFRASSLVPRRAGGDGNVTDLLWTNPLVPEESYRSLLAHEFQHLINFNQHVLVRQGISEESWLNEGLSHLAEDLVDEPPNDNYQLVRTFLGDPGSVGLSRGMLTLATRGAAYLFVRSLVDLLGEGVLLRLVQTDRVGRGNIEAATGESFADLMARWGAQLYVSGTGRSSHPRLNYRIPSLRPPEGRGFPLPVPVAWGWGEEPPGLGIRPWGLQFLRVTGGGRGTPGPADRAEGPPGGGAAAGGQVGAGRVHGRGPLYRDRARVDAAPGAGHGRTPALPGDHRRHRRDDPPGVRPRGGGEAQTFFLLVDEGASPGPSSSATTRPTFTPSTSTW